MNPPPTLDFSPHVLELQAARSFLSLISAAILLTGIIPSVWHVYGTLTYFPAGKNIFPYYSSFSCFYSIMEKKGEVKLCGPRSLFSPGNLALLLNFASLKKQSITEQPWVKELLCLIQPSPWPHFTAKENYSQRDWIICPSSYKLSGGGRIFFNSQS